MSDEVSELRAVLLYRGRPHVAPETWVRAWEGWDYGCRIERQDDDGADVFKGGAFVIVRVAAGQPELPWDDLEQQAELLKGVPDAFDHASALSAAQASDHRAEVTVRILEPGPWIVLTEFLITLAGLIEATGAMAAWLPHCRALVTSGDFLAESEALQQDGRRGGATHPYALYMSVQLRLPLDRGQAVVGFTQGLARLGWPEFEIEDFVRPRTPAVIYKTLVNAGLHQLTSKGAVEAGEYVVTSAGRLRAGSVRPSANLEGDVMPLEFLD
ncbi:protein of unknown function [Beijerinckiaceae bacterium RH AL1]|nr:hypothetical protein [Beijerinckiaceae bacterium]VVB42345.1 protein of unknown function [Beijerinckiaceae bacterium RH AL8]VVB42346.1 protein of unknown function [Beijerinckiaceae bacterium RH CH11]VVC53262.1 protein of unknown function [Beijerinckiaceae bacterium RH AL1]